MNCHVLVAQCETYNCCTRRHAHGKEVVRRVKVRRAARGVFMVCFDGGFFTGWIKIMW